MQPLSLGGSKRKPWSNDVLVWGSASDRAAIRIESLAGIARSYHEQQFTGRKQSKQTPKSALLRYRHLGILRLIPANYRGAWDMMRLGLVVLIILCGVLAFTNPGQDAHRKTFYASVATEKAKSEVLGKIAADVLGDVDLVPLKYNNYFLFSTTTLNGEMVSVGVFSRVWSTK
jgi:hypothetical protein